MTTISPTAVRVRMAPSPTGPLHIGTARTSLYNFLFARHMGGTFVLRIEDTDVARGSEAFERDIIEGLHWLGLTWDEGPQVAGGEDIGAYGPYRQSQRMDRYAAEAERLLAAGAAYRCYCTPEELDAERRAQVARREPPRYSGRCRKLSNDERLAFEAEGRTSAIRFAVPPEKVAFDDVIRGTGRVRQRAARRLRDRAQRWDAALPLRGGGRRRGDGDQPRRPRRGAPLEHAQADRPLPRAGIRDPALRARAAHPEPGPLEDEQAEERRPRSTRIGSRDICPRRW